MLAIVDYGASNIKSVEKAFQHLGVDPVVSSDPNVLSQASILVCPGQGAFNQSMVALKDSGLGQVITQHIAAKKPFLGICLGFQLLFETSNENGAHNGFGTFNGHVTHFSEQFKDESNDLPNKAKLKVSHKAKLKIPHMGWNKLQVLNSDDPYFKGVDGEYVYFVHSYAVFGGKTHNFSRYQTKGIGGTTTTYGVPFLSAVSTDTILATQFHPEKSGDVGLKILKNFLEKHQ